MLAVCTHFALQGQQKMQGTHPGMAAADTELSTQPRLPKPAEHVTEYGWRAAHGGQLSSTWEQWCCSVLTLEILRTQLQPLRTCACLTFLPSPCWLPSAPQRDRRQPEAPPPAPALLCCLVEHRRLPAVLPSACWDLPALESPPGPGAARSQLQWVLQRQLAAWRPCRTLPGVPALRLRCPQSWPSGLSAPCGGPAADWAPCRSTRLMLTLAQLVLTSDQD